MRFTFDIGHPAHVHYFRTLMARLESEGHQTFVTARERPDVAELLNAYGIEFSSRGEGASSTLGKAVYMTRATAQLYRHATTFRPDAFMSFASPYAAQAAWLYGKPHIAFDDTETARLGQLCYAPFSDRIYTPLWFGRDLGRGHRRFDSFMEEAYLSPQVFEPRVEVYRMLGLEPGEPYSVVRLVGWTATHDRGHVGVRPHDLKRLMGILRSRGRVFISSERAISDTYESYRLKTPADWIHDVLAFAEIFVGESATMAAESAILGTPSLYISSLAESLSACAELSLRYRHYRHHPTLSEAEESLEDLLTFGRSGRSPSRSSNLTDLMYDALVTP